MCRVIAIANHKSGVAKTTTVASLGIGLANKGYNPIVCKAKINGTNRRTVQSGQHFKGTKRINRKYFTMYRICYIINMKGATVVSVDW